MLTLWILVDAKRGNVSEIRIRLNDFCNIMLIKSASTANVFFDRAEALNTKIRFI